MSAALLESAALPSALAGDAATPAVIGFSKDGRYFAFEEYGTSDAAVRPSSTLFMMTPTPAAPGNRS